MKETILQFGTGNFLRAFICDFINTLNDKGLYDGKIVIVSPTNSKNVDIINYSGPAYHLVLRGVRDGEPKEELKEINSVSRAVNPYADFGAFLDIAKKPDLRFVVSNTTEAGIAFDPSCRFEDAPAASFPGKLTQLLYCRWREGLSGLVILPCELIDKNADALREYLLKYASLWELPEEFINWIEKENVFCNTLVDRIVTGYPDDAEKWNAVYGKEDPLLDTAELYHFWAIDGSFENELPLQKAGLNVVWTNDVPYYKKRKVRLLNGAHTSMVFPALLAGKESVIDCMEDADIKTFLEACLHEIVLPVIGETSENISFANSVTERFSNPFIKHRLKSIALNSVSKFSVRVLPTMLEYKEKFGAYPKPMILSLCALIKYYKSNDISDLPENVDFIRNRSLSEILDNSDLWGTSLDDMGPDVFECFAIENIREAFKWSLS
ncbi:MAG: tagaturonate reductase [Clostridia bacterium]|nr:tagaturonate reductase [Clostridia bacterium]